MKSLLRPILFSTLLAAAVPALADVQVNEPFVRAMPPGSETTAAYFTLENGGEAPRRLVAVESELAARAELHEQIHEDGLLKMRRVEAITIPAHGAAVLEPGGLHVMLLGLRQALQPGEQVVLTLEFADGERLPVKAEVRRPSGGAAHGHGHAH